MKIPLKTPCGGPARPRDGTWDVPLIRLSLALLLIAPLRGAEASPQLESALAAVRKANDQKRYPEALQLARDAVQRFPNSSEAWRHRALATRLSGDLPTALQDYGKAIELDPRNVSAWSGRGQCRRALKDYPAAIADFDQALAINPRYITALALRADTRTDLGDLQGALAEIEALIALDEKRPESFHSRMYIRNKLKDWKGMEADCNRILDLNPNYSKSIHYARGLARAELGRHKEAIADFETCISAGHQTEQAAVRKKKSQDALKAKGGFLAKLAQFEKQVDIVLGAIGGGPASGGTVSTVSADPATAKPAPPPASTPEPKRAEPRVANASPVTVTPPTETPPPKAAAAKPDVNVTTAPPARTEPPEQPVPPLAESDRPWAQSASTSAAAPRIKAELPPLTLQPTLELKGLTAAAYNGAVSAAMEAMRLVQEPMNAAETSKFEKKWAPLFNFPTQEAVDYFNRLNPLLDEFLMLRGVIAQAAPVLDEAWVEAKFAAAYESETGTRQAMAIVAHQTRLLQSAQSQLAVVVRKIAEVGNPPSPVAAQEAARKRHETATKLAQSLIPILTVTPTKRESAAGAACTFTPKGVNLPTGASLVWTFGDGETARGELAPVQHVYAKEGKYVLEVTALDTKRQPLANARAQVTISKSAEKQAKTEAAGAWVLARIERKELKPQDFGYAYPPARTDCQDTSFAVNGTFSPYKPPVIGKITWSLPPARLKPHESIEIPWQVSGADPRHVSAVFRVTTTYRVEGRSELSLHDSNNPGNVDLRKPAGNYRLARGLNAPRDHVKVVIRGYQIEIRVEMGDMSETMGYGHSFFGQSRTLHYVFDPTGAMPPLAETGGDVPAVSAIDPAQQAKKQAIAEHQTNIAAIEKFLARDREELGRTTDPRNRADFEARILTAEADIQAEKDLIASIETGEYVHTRTAYDEHVHAQFVGNIQREQQQLSAVLKILDRSERLIALAPPAEHERLREFARRQLSPELIATRDLAKARHAMDAIGRQVQGHYQSEAARQDEKAAWAEFGVEAATNIKSAADTGLFAISLAGSGGSINLLYQAGTGYVEGGPREAILRAATTYSDAIDYAVTAYDGYQRGGLAGVGQDLAWKYVQDKSIGWVAGKLQRGTGPGAQKRAAELAEQLEVARFNRERAQGEARVHAFQQAQQALQEAGRRGAAPETIQRLQAEVRDKATIVADSLHAKNYLKYKCDAQTGAAYDSHMRAVHAEVDARMKDDMRRDKWNADDWELMEFRNSASYGRPNMDRDAGLREKPLWELDDYGRPLLDADKRWIPNPERWEMKNGVPVPKPQVTKNKKPMTLQQWQKEASDAYERAYAAVTGRSARRAMEGITTSVHPEAYKDRAWLEENKRHVSAAWASQAADVTRYKVHAPEHADADSSRFTKMQEVARGTAKDIETKLLPVLASARPLGTTTVAQQRSERAASAAHAHWQEIHRILAAFGRNDIDPIHASRRIRELTGGRTIAEIADQMGALLEGTLKLGG